jgi:hypothetical protein
MKLDPIKQAQAVKAIKSSIAAIGEEGDDQLVLDTVEGETDFLEVVDAILARIADDGALAKAIDAQVSDLNARKERFKKRIETNKALLEQAFIEADLPKVERPLATVYLSNRAPKVIVETESDIPARYWKPGDPKLDQKALLEDLKARRAALEALPEDPAERAAAYAALPPDIPGATLSNGTRSLSIRTA